MGEIKDWQAIRSVFRKSFASSFHFAVASVNADGIPHISPIGSLLLDLKEPRGFFFEIFTTQLRTNIEANRNVCVLAVNSGMRFWLRSLFAGRFSEPPAIRLYGLAGARRLASADEIRAWQRRTGILRRLKGYALLWGNLKYVREIQFTGVEEVKMGKMTSSPRES